MSSVTFTRVGELVCNKNERQEAMARSAMRREVALHVEKAEYEQQAAFLMHHNYKYKAVAEDRSGYRQDLVDKLPETRALPSCLEACAKFVPERSDAVDVTKAHGPSTSTTAAQQEFEAEDHDEEQLDKWLLVCNPWGTLCASIADRHLNT